VGCVALGVLQGAAMDCSLLQCVAVGRSVLQWVVLLSRIAAECCSWSVAVRCSVLQCAIACCSVLQWAAVDCCALKSVALGRSVLQWVALLSRITAECCS